MKNRLNFFHLKLIAIFAMTIDHIAWIFIETGSMIGQSMHFIGRITAPMMCFLLVEGFFRSQNLKKYVLRLFIFALLAQLPFLAMFKGWDIILNDPEIIFYKFNVLFNLLFGLLSLIIWYSKLKVILKILLITLFLLFSMSADWGVFIIIFVLVLAAFRDNRKHQIVAYIITAMSLLLLVDLGVVHGLPTLVLQWMPIGILVVPIFWFMSNNEFGSRFGGKYFFYIYYPLHMFVLSLLKLI